MIWWLDLGRARRYSVQIRFPNDDRLPLGGPDAGKLIDFSPTGNGGRPELP
jgi:hypothetical protein